MAVYFLYYLNPDTPPPYDWQGHMTRADQVIGMYNWGQVRVDSDNLTNLPVPDNGWPIITVRSLDEAINHPRLKGYRWIWLHPKATKLLQDFKHPKDNVVYCVGDEKNGFENRKPNELLGEVLRIWTPDQDREYYAETVLQLVVYDRALKLKTW